MDASETRGVADLATPSPGVAPTAEVAVGRQPVVDRERRVVGFELLYRPVQPDSPLADR